MYSRVGFLYHQEREKEKERERESPKALCSSVPVVCSLRFFSFFFQILFFPSFVGCFWKKTEESASDIFLSSSSSSSSKVFFSLTKESALLLIIITQKNLSKRTGLEEDSTKRAL